MRKDPIPWTTPRVLDVMQAQRSGWHAELQASPTILKKIPVTSEMTPAVLTPNGFPGAKVVRGWIVTAWPAVSRSSAWHYPIRDIELCAITENHP